MGNVRVSWSKGKTDTKNKTRQPRKLPASHALDAMLSLLAALALVLLISAYAEDVAPGSFSVIWICFIPVNAAYLIYGYTKGSLVGKRADAADAIVALTGPIAFYFWVILGAYRKYIGYPIQRKKQRLELLRKRLQEENLELGFDFDIPFKYKEDVTKILLEKEMQQPLYWEIITEPWTKNGEEWITYSITDTAENFVEREELR